MVIIIGSYQKMGFLKIINFYNCGFVAEIVAGNQKQNLCKNVRTFDVSQRKSHLNTIYIHEMSLFYFWPFYFPPTVPLYGSQKDYPIRSDKKHF